MKKLSEWQLCSVGRRYILILCKRWVIQSLKKLTTGWVKSDLNVQIGRRYSQTSHLISNISIKQSIQQLQVTWLTKNIQSLGDSQSKLKNGKKSWRSKENQNYDSNSIETSNQCHSNGGYYSCKNTKHLRLIFAFLLMHFSIQNMF